MTDLRAAPQNLDAERQLLGGCLREPEWVPELGEILRPDDFFNSEHGALWRELTGLTAAGISWDAVTLLDRVPQSRWHTFGGVGYVMELPDKATATANLRHYADLIAELSTRRRVIAMARKWIDQAHEPDPDGAMTDRIVQDVKDLGQPGGAVRGEWIGDTMARYIDRNWDLREQKQSPYLRLGLRDLDALLRLSPGDLAILGGRPGMAKTALALNVLLWRAGALGAPGGMFSLEMSPPQLMARLVTQRTGINMRVIGDPARMSEQDMERVGAVEAEIKQLPLIVDYRSGLTIEEVRAEARRWVTLHGVRMIVVDYLQLMQGPDRRVSREQQVSDISRGLKQMAKDLQIVVLALAQLSRGLESRTDKRPVSSDLRESGSLEQDADALLFLYRDHYYTGNTITRRDAEVLVRKQRNGPSGMVGLQWYGETQMFRDGLTPEERRDAAAAAAAKKAGKSKAPKKASEQEDPPPEMFEDRKEP